jgi:hypothetical protein
VIDAILVVWSIAAENETASISNYERVRGEKASKDSLALHPEAKSEEGFLVAMLLAMTAHSETTKGFFDFVAARPQDGRGKWARHFAQNDTLDAWRTSG